jgi:hypothetical protein
METISLLKKKKLLDVLNLQLIYRSTMMQLNRKILKREKKRLSSSSLILKKVCEKNKI